MPYNLSLALGSGAFAPLEIVRAYAVFSNGGYLVTPYIISRVETGNGEVIFEHEALSVCQDCELESLENLELQAEVEETAEDEKDLVIVEEDSSIQYAPRVISAQNAYIMRSIMREVVSRGTAVRAKALGRTDIAGKTGTTNGQIDAW